MNSSFDQFVEMHWQSVENAKLSGVRPSTPQERRDIMNRRGYLDQLQTMNMLSRDCGFLNSVACQISHQDYGGSRFYFRDDVLQLKRELDRVEAYRRANPYPWTQHTLTRYDRR